MQTFTDTASGDYWQLEDSVRIVESGTGLHFFTAAGQRLEVVPETLVRIDALPHAPVALPVPQSVSRYQGREATRLTPYGDSGMSLFDAAVELLARPETPAYYVRAWDELQAFEYGSPMLTAIADELGLTKDDLDDLFLFAASLKA